MTFRIQGGTLNVHYENIPKTTKTKKWLAFICAIYELVLHRLSALYAF